MALEWLKTILGEHYTEEIDKQVSGEIGKAFVSKADFNIKNDALKDATKQLAEANTTIDGFKAMDIDSIKKAADDWKLKAEKAEKDATAKIAEIQFDSRLETAILSKHGRSAKAIKAMLDVDTLRKSQNQDSDITAALEALAKDNSYMFEESKSPDTTTPPDGATGGIRLNSGAPLGGGNTPDYNSMSDAEYYAAMLKKDK